MVKDVLKGFCVSQRNNNRRKPRTSNRQDSFIQYQMQKTWALRLACQGRPASGTHSLCNLNLGFLSWRAIGGIQRVNIHLKGKKCLYITSDQKGCKGPAHDEWSWVLPTAISSKISAGIMSAWKLPNVCPTKSTILTNNVFDKVLGYEIKTQN